MNQGYHLSQVANVMDKAKLVTLGEQLYPSDLELLREHECWQTLINYYEPKANGKTNIEFKTEIARIYLYNLSDKNKAVQAYNSIILQDKVEFDEYYTILLTKLVEAKDLVQVNFLEDAKDKFKNKDKVKCLQRLCFIYEKKIFQDENKILEYYTELLKIDNNNTKALKFFKNIYTLNGKWSEVVHILTKLLNSTKYQGQRNREALELASILVYQLNQPREGIKILERYCSDNSLDAGTLLYNAYEMVGENSKCISLLQKTLPNASTPEELATLHFKLGCLYLNERTPHKAHPHLVESLNFSPSRVMTLEKLIETQILQKKWRDALSYLKQLENLTNDFQLRIQLESTIKRIVEVI